MNIKFIGDVDQFTRDFLREQYNQHPELLKQEMIMTSNILAATNKRREDEKKHLDGLDAMQWLKRYIIKLVESPWLIKLRTFSFIVILQNCKTNLKFCKLFLFI